MAVESPIVLIIHAQTRPSLPELDREVANLRDTFLQSREFEPHILTDASPNRIFAELRDRGGRVAVIHYAGHANGKGVLLPDGGGEGGVAFGHAAGLADALRQLDSLRVLFLNGCATKDQVMPLLEAGVPAIIATMSGISDHIATVFASQFYKCLASGRDIQEAFEHAQAFIKMTEGEQSSTAYADTHNAPAEHLNGWPWSLYGTKESKAWKLADAVGDQATASIPASFKAPASGSSASVLTATDSVELEITLPDDYESFSEDKKKKLLKAIGDFLDLDTDIKITRMRRGSTVLTLELRAAEAERLAWAMRRGEFEGFRISKVEILDSDQIEIPFAEPVRTQEPSFRRRPSSRQHKLKPIPPQTPSNLSLLDVPSFLMCPPLSYSTAVPNNAWMADLSIEERKVIPSKAMRQFQALYQFIAARSLVQLLPVPRDCGLQDLVFTANLGVVLEHLPDKDSVIVSNFKSEPRMGETEVGVNFFQSMGYKAYVPGTKFEGEAELKHLHDNVYVGGYGLRSERDTYEQLEEQFGMTIVKVRETDPYLYHLDCSVFPLTNEKTLVCTEMFTDKEVAEIEKHTEIVDVTRRQALPGLCNSVRLGNIILNGSHIHDLSRGSEAYHLEIEKNRRLEDIAAANGFEVALFNLSECLKGGAALSCLIMHLNRVSYHFRLI